MAKATMNEVRVTLDMSLDEARFVYDLLGQCVIGRGERRVLSSKVFYALDALPLVSNDDFASDLVGYVQVREEV